MTRTVGQSAAVMGAVAAGARVLGGVRVLVIAAILGTTFLGNSFEAANTFPTVVFELLAAGALSAVLVPTFVGLFERGDQAEAERQAGGLLGVVAMALGGLALVGMIFAPQLAALLTTTVGDPVVAAQQEELIGQLLRYFMPQLVLYAIGFLSIALLNARRSFALPAAAPIGNTVVLVMALVVFRLMAGPAPGLELSSGEVAILGLGGTVGVAVFVAVPLVALARSGFRLRPRLLPRDPAVRRLLRLSGWAVLQHTGAAILLGAALILGAAVEGGVVAYRVAFFVFLAPYGIIAQPIHTTVQPELAAQADEPARFAQTLRWALDSLSVTLVPVAVVLVALAVPLMRIAAFGQANTPAGIDLLAAGTASLGLGLVGYGAFRLLATAWYALGDSRTPAVAAVVTAGVGTALMIVLSPLVDGAARVFVLGVGHSTAFLLGAAWLWYSLRRRLGEQIWPSALVGAVLAAVILGAGAWAFAERVAPDSKLSSALVVSAVIAVAGSFYWWFVRRVGLAPGALPVAGARP